MARTYMCFIILIINLLTMVQFRILIWLPPPAPCLNGCICQSKEPGCHPPLKGVTWCGPCPLHPSSDATDAALCKKGRVLPSIAHFALFSSKFKNELSRIEFSGKMKDLFNFNNYSSLVFKAISIKLM